jgi:hypothetical protein
MLAKFNELIITGIVGVLVFSNAALAERLNDVNLSFTLQVPDDFQRDPALAIAKPDILYAFRKVEPGDIGVIIIIERMRGVLGRARLDLSLAPAGVTAKVFTVRWHDFDLDAVEVQEQVGSVEAINYNVQVPLKPEAIQIRVAGPRDQKDQLLVLTNSLLDGLQGQSNWLHSSAPRALAESSSYGYVLLGSVALGIVGGFVFLLRVRRRTGRGTVLGLAVLIYGVSWILAPGATREMRAAVGAFRMLGFLGFLLGAYDLFRHRAAKRPAEEPTAAVDRGNV